MIRIMLILAASLAMPNFEAFAQSRDVYTVRGIEVDERAASLIKAQQQAFAAAKLEGAQRLIERITLAEDRAAGAGFAINQETAERLAAAVDVEEETAGAGRYRGRLAVVFNPANVRAYLERYAIAYTDQPAPLAVVIPVDMAGVGVDWGLAWPDRSVGQLAPTLASRSTGFTSFSDWTAISGEVDFLGAKRGVLAELLGVPGSYRVKVSSVTPSGVRELGTTRRVLSLEEAVRATNDLLDVAWKRSAVIRDTSRTLVEANVSYTSLAEWNTLRGALARSPLVSDFLIKAVSVEGAVVAFAFAGDEDTLEADLRDRGLQLQAEPIGWVLTSAISSLR